MCPRAMKSLRGDGEQSGANLILLPAAAAAAEPSGAKSPAEPINLRPPTQCEFGAPKRGGPKVKRLLIPSALIYVAPN